MTRETRSFDDVSSCLQVCFELVRFFQLSLEKREPWKFCDQTNCFQYSFLRELFQVAYPRPFFVISLQMWWRFLARQSENMKNTSTFRLSKCLGGFSYLSLALGIGPQVRHSMSASDISSYHLVYILPKCLLVVSM